MMNVRIGDGKKIRYIYFLNNVIYVVNNFIHFSVILYILCRRIENKIGL